MKILVGVMYCIENEFEECINSIKNQTYKKFEYFVIQNLPNKEAHEKLYQTFMDNSSDFDYFIKVDADMVLARNTFFEEVCARLQTDRNIDDLEIMVHDFFTDELIFGLHIYSNRYRWKKNDEKIFVDYSSSKKYKRVQDRKLLTPAAFHCPNPSKFQSFHFGVHKAIKVLQKQVGARKRYQMLAHWRNIERTKIIYSKDKKLPHGFASMGAEIALRNSFTYEQANFEDSVLLRHFSQVRDFNNKQIESFLKKLDISSFTFLPKELRKELLFYKNSENKLSYREIKQLIRLVYSELTISHER